MTTENVDSQLVELSRRIDDFVDLTMQDNSSYSIFCIGALLDDSALEREDKLQTCLAAGGKLDIIEESLYAELANQILSGDARLFFMLSNVVAALDEQLGEKIASLENVEDVAFSAADDEPLAKGNADDGDILSGFDIDVLTSIGAAILPRGSNGKH